MRFPLKTTIVLLILGGIGASGYFYLPAYWKKFHKKDYRFAEVSNGSIVADVNATGTVQPVLSISVGTFVSGPIEELFVDFNDVVREGQLLAKLDPRIYQANVDRDKAQLETRKAELARVEALLQQAINNEERAKLLRKENPKFISNAEMDQFKFERMSLQAQKSLALASVQQAQAALNNSEVNLKYTEILSPVNGVIIDRKIDQGQTVAASFQTPELFIIAPDLGSVHIEATVDEADIGLVTAAKNKGLPVSFTVDAYPDDLFTGKIYQIRKNSTETQNVVTYPVIVKAENPALPLPTGIGENVAVLTAGTTGLLGSRAKQQRLLLAPYMVHLGRVINQKLALEYKLLPGMTASLSFQVGEVNNVIRIPNAALRFYPQREQVRPKDRKILDGVQYETRPDDDTAQSQMTAKEKAELRRERNRRHVWVVEGDYLKAIEVVTGISNNKYTELITGKLVEGQKLVTGIQTAE